MKRLLGVGVLWMALVAPSQLAADSCTDQGKWVRCPNALQNQTFESSPTTRWSEDEDYWLIDLTKVGRKRLFITGDIVHLSEVNFPNLVRLASDQRTDVQQIVVDAREIVVDIPIYVDSLQLELRAERVVFLGRGEVVLAEPPLFQDGFALVTRHLDLSQSRRKPFNFVTQKPGWQTIRTVAVSAESVQTELSTPPTDYVAYIRGKTKDDIAGVTSLSAYSVDFASQAARDRYASLFRSDMVWPIATAGKLSRHFSQAPYNPANRAFVQALAAQYYSQLPVPRLDYARALFRRVDGAARQEVDLHGRSAYFVPRQDFRFLVDFFERSNSESFAVLNLWLKVLKDTLQGGPSQQRAELRSRLRAEVDSLTAEARRIEAQMVDAKARIGAIDAEIAGKQNLLDTYRLRLEACIQDQQNAAAKKQQLSGAMSLVTLAGTAAAVAFCPPAAPYVAGGMSLAQALIDQGPINNPQDLVEVATRAKKASDDYRQKADALVSASQAVIAALKTGKYTGLDKTLSDSGSKLSALADWARQATSTTLDPAAAATAIAGCDVSALNAIKAEYIEAQNRLGQAQGELVGLSGRVLTIGAQVDLQQQKVTELNLEGATNDRERIALQTLSLAVWDDVFAQLAATAPDVMRAYSYSTGQAAASNSILAEMAASYLERHETLKDLRGQLKKGEDAIDGTQLLQEIEQRYLVFRTTILNVRYGEKVVAERLFPPSTVQYDFSGADGYRPFAHSNGTFVRRVNEEVGRQFQQLVHGGAPPKPALIELPSTVLPTRGLVGRWAQLDQARVSGLKMGNKRALKAVRLDLAIVHPAFGNLCNAQDCFFVDFRDERAEQNAIAYVTSVDPRGRLIELPRVAEGYARPPLSTQYYLAVGLSLREDLNGAARLAIRPPVIQRIGVSVRSIERR